MKTRSLFFLISLSLPLAAQTPISKIIPVKGQQKFILNAEDPELVLKTWDKQEIQINGNASINRGENDSAFDIQVVPSGDAITVTMMIKDKENLPHRITIKKGDTEYFFKAKDFHDPEVQKFLDDNGNEYSYMSTGIIREIKLEIMVPRNMTTEVQAKYGMVEVVNFDAPLNIESKFGGVDATINAGAIGQIIARSRHGEILTNLGIKFDQANTMDRSNKWTEISASPGSGPKYQIESKFGNVYLRKSK